MCVFARWANDTVPQHNLDFPVSGSCKEYNGYIILAAHNTSGNMENLQIKFDKLTSHDITFVGIIQTREHQDLKNSRCLMY